MKKLFLLLSTSILFLHFSACTEKKEMVDEVLITGKVVDTNGNLVQNTRISIAMSSLMLPSVTLHVEYNKTGNFTHTVAIGDEDLYKIEVEKEGYQIPPNMTYSIDKYKKRQTFEIVLEKIE